MTSFFHYRLNWISTCIRELWSIHITEYNSRMKGTAGSLTTRMSFEIIILSEIAHHVAMISFIQKSIKCILTWSAKKQNSGCVGPRVGEMDCSVARTKFGNHGNLCLDCGCIFKGMYVFQTH